MVDTTSTASERRPSAMAARVWKLAGAILVIPALGLGNFVYSQKDQNPTYNWFPFVVLTLVLLYGGLSCYKRGKRLNAATARALIEQDERPVVLYLRSFKDDVVAASVPMAGVLGLAAILLGLETEEEQLAEAMNEVGPFVAIGKPGELLPEVGAARMYVSDNEWQSRVSELMSRALLVVLRAGETSSLWWEVKTAAEKAGPEKLIFLLPFKKKQYEVFRKSAKEFLPCALPDYVSGHTLVGSRVRAILYFERDWTPHLMKFKVPLSLSINPLVGAFRRALQPLVEHFHLELKRPKRRLFSRLLKTIPGTFLVLGVLALPGHLVVQDLMERSAVERNKSAVEHNDAGYGLYQKGDLEGAIREYHEALRLNPQLASAHNNLGMALHNKHEVLGALWEYSQALRLNPELAVARNNRGLIYYEIATPSSGEAPLLLYDNDHNEMYNPTVENAILDYREALRLEPGLAVAHNNLGLALYSQHDLKGASAEFGKAYQLAPENSTFRENYELVQRELTQ
jgi:tetratricopeptide (TPR) repeat protein